MQQPSIGRIVHFHQQEVVGTITNHGPVTRTYAAIVTEVLPRDHGEGDITDDDRARLERGERVWPLPPTPAPRVSLRVFLPDRDQSITGVPFSEDARPEHWSWPPRA